MEKLFITGTYIGDVWCYAIDEALEKCCFLSIVIFNKDYWNKGLGSEALDEFIQEIKERYQVDTISAFTYKFNIASIKTLEKIGFQCIEEFVEQEISSLYYELEI